MIVGFALSLVLIAATILIHYEALRLTSLGLAELAIPVHARILVVLTTSIASHCIHITLYALAYMGLHWIGGYGTIGGAG